MKKQALFIFFMTLSTQVSYGDTIYRFPGEKFTVVKNKLYPKTKTLEIGLPGFGFILNQSLISTYVLSSHIGYYFNESWGVHLEGSYLLNSDNSARRCLENWYHEIDADIAQMTQPCPNPEQSPLDPLRDENGKFKNGVIINPIYTAIREIDLITSLSLVWNPLYGKQLAFLSFMTYFDLYFKLGGGLAFSKYYREQPDLKNGNRSDIPVSDDIKKGECPGKRGVCPAEESNPLLFVGKNGRNTPEDQVTPLVTFAIGQKFHFLKKAHLKVEFRNYTLFGENDLENYLSLWTGVGFRF